MNQAVLAILAVLAFSSIARTQPEGHMDSLVQIIRIDTSLHAPVVLADDTILIISVGGRNFGADRRAGVTSAQIKEAADDWSTSTDSLTMTDEGVGTNLYLDGRFLMTVFDADALVAGVERQGLAENHGEAIRQAIVRYRDERDRESFLQGLLYTVLATIGLFVSFWLVGRLFGWADNRILRRVHGIRLKAVEIVREEWLHAGIRVIIRLVRWSVVILLVYLYLTFVLTRFVWTRGIASQVIEFTLAPVRVFGFAVKEYLPNLFFLFVIVLITRFVVRFLKMVANEVSKGVMSIPGFYQDWGIPTYNILRVVIIAFAFVVAFPYIPGSQSPAFQGMSLFLGLLFSLGSTSAVANVVAGIILTYMRSFRVGEVVKINETVGMVASQGMLVTRLRTAKNVEVSIPNSTVLTTHVTNYSSQASEGKLILHTSVTIGYDAPWRQIHGLLRMAADATPMILKDPEPFVLQRSLDDFYVTYELNVYTDAPEKMLRILSELHKNIQDAFNEHSVQIMSPNYEADRSSPTIVPKDRWYAKPAKKPGEPGADL